MALDAALAAVEPSAAVRRLLTIDRTGLRIGAFLHPLRSRVVVVGAGKASAPIASAVEEHLLTAGIQPDPASVVVVKHGHGLPLKHIRIQEAGHPIPDANGERGAAAIESAVSGLSAADLVIVCLSGGASALLPAPKPPLTLADLQTTTASLLASGADIHLVNAARRRLSRLAAGGLAYRAAPATVITLALSDVPGDDTIAIGSAPTLAETWTRKRLDAELAMLGVLPRLPQAVQQLLAVDWPKAAPLPRSLYRLLGRNQDAVSALSTALVMNGFTPVTQSEPLSGDAAAAAVNFCVRASELPPGHALVAGGETTVTLGHDHGTGGRNQEFALAAAQWIQRHGTKLTVLAAGTDGTDGPTDAAGGWADGGTIARGNQAGLDAEVALHRHDSHPFLRAAGDLLITGPTRTNVMDVAVALRE